MDIDVVVDPIPEQLVQRLDEFSEELQDKAMSSGLTASAKPIKDRMKRLVPKVTRSLYKSIGQAVLSKTAKARIGISQDVRAIVVGPVRKVADPTYEGGKKKISQGYKAYWLEYTGAEAHEIVPNPARRLKALKIKRGIAGEWGGLRHHFKRVTIPTWRPRKFMAPALDSAGSLVGDGFYNGMSRRLNQFQGTQTRSPKRGNRRGI